ncbi:hypothetical protein BMI86_00070 [Thioclava sp. DLFJ5-1]|uniref:hypothetical protein n=1 Tax=Thioclava sp. DLFJ5-1 TaxID=1915314 RepID=UPI000996ECA1|nr:hypothetical protein [Thioclava sp. DLFJ5-1]OOY21031.1 hypothetical protein BMI86_00070 [Thioclava sp. DLFJ5-1]
MNQPKFNSRKHLTRLRDIRDRKRAEALAASKRRNELLGALAAARADLAKIAPADLDLGSVGRRIAEVMRGRGMRDQAKQAEAIEARIAELEPEAEAAKEAAESASTIARSAAQTYQTAKEYAIEHGLPLPIETETRRVEG